jgi:hypothetical protein
MSDATVSFVDRTLEDLRARAAELQPLVDEHSRVEAAIKAITDSDEQLGITKPAAADRTPAQPAKKTTARKRTPKPRTRKSTAGKPGRPKGSGIRGKQALELVRQKPGITIPELAVAMGIKQNYLYRVMPGLQQQGVVYKQNKGWFSKDEK